VKVMVACNTLTFVEVETDTWEAGPARVFNLPENITVEKWKAEDDSYSHTVLACDPEEEDLVTQEIVDRAAQAAKDWDGGEWRFEERTS
jgi:hypothetical protein